MHLLQIMDDVEWANNILENILVACRLEVTINVELWIVINGLPALPTDIVNKLCPDQCNGHGTCVRGQLKLLISNFLMKHKFNCLSLPN